MQTLNLRTLQGLQTQPPDHQKHTGIGAEVVPLSQNWSTFCGMHTGVTEGPERESWIASSSANLALDLGFPA